MKRYALAALVVLGAALPPGVREASAVTVTGTLSPAYGAPLSTQTTQTNWTDSNLGLMDLANGSELDQAYGYISNGVLYLFFSGNLMYIPSNVGPGTVGHELDVFIDSQPGGQNQLRSDNYAQVISLAGLSFDAGITPDFWLSCSGDAVNSPHPLAAFYAVLLTTGGGTGYYLGQGPPGGPGTLSGGTNPNGVLVTINNHNTAGVTSGCGAASGTGVTTGVEWAIPLAAIGNPIGCVIVCAFVSQPGSGYLLNQVLGPLPSGTCNLGAPGGVNFASLPGNQYFTICTGVTSARAATWGSLKTIYH